MKHYTLIYPLVHVCSALFDAVLNGSNFDLPTKSFSLTIQMKAI